MVKQDVTEIVEMYTEVPVEVVVFQVQTITHTTIQTHTQTHTHTHTHTSETHRQRCMHTDTIHVQQFIYKFICMCICRIESLRFL